MYVRERRGGGNKALCCIGQWIFFDIISIQTHKKLSLYKITEWNCEWVIVYKISPPQSSILNCINMTFHYL